jgi:hypothetical protein
MKLPLRVEAHMYSSSSRAKLQLCLSGYTLGER